MATFLDFSLLSGARAIFAFLLIFCLIFALLKFTNIFKMSDNLNAVIAFVVSILSLFSPSMIAVIQVVTPWYVLMMIIIVFVLLIVMIFGSLGDNIGDIKGNLGSKYKTIMVWIIVVSFIIFFSGLGYVFLGGSSSEFALNRDQTANTSSSGSGDIGRQADLGDVGGTGVGTFLETLFHPKVIGMILFLIIASLTVLLMSYGGH